MNMTFNPRKFFILVLLSASLSAFAVAQPAVQPSPASGVGSSATNARQTVQGLTAKIAERLAHPELRRGQIGIKVVSLNTGKVLFQQNGEKYFMPASNMKNFTVATALEKLTPDFKFVTSVYSTSAPDPSGVVKGLRVFGRGD